MRDDRFLRAVGDIDDSYVDEAMEDIKYKPVRPIKRIVILAACVAVLAATLAIMIPAMMKSRDTSPAPATPAQIETDTEVAPTTPAQSETDADTATKEAQYESDLPVTIFSQLWPDRSLEELVTGADLIVRAKNFGAEPSYVNEEGTDRHVYTDYLFEVTESYKGDVRPSDTVKVKYYGGDYDGMRYVIAGEVVIREGREYILILTRETDENDEPTGSGKYVFFPPKGILAEDESGKYTASDPSVSYTADEFRAEVERILG